MITHIKILSVCFHCYTLHFFYATLFLIGAPSSFCHEHASIGIFDFLIHENKLVPFFASCGLGLEDINFVKELILG